MYRYTMKEILTFHEPYERISLRQIKQARNHARKLGPGSSVPKVVNHRVRLDTNKVDHFVEFINRPYFYQDVAFGTRTLTVEGGREVTMPNVIRTFTRSTMVMQYLQYCKEQNFDPVSRSTMYRILEVREASQQKSLCGIDNTAAEGVTSFERLSNILEELIQVGGDKKNLNDLKTKLSEGKKYLKTEYKMNCSSEESECADHCRRFALSDSDNPNFKAACSHKHTQVCSKCEQLKTTLNEIEKTIKSHASNLYSKEQRDDLFHDFKTSENGILSWKCHIIRSVNQEYAKQDVLRDLDWAMKFLQLRYRERQSEWYGKRGLSWHISSVVTRDKETKQIKVLCYAHLFDSCSQDWYAVTSTIENLLLNIKTKFPNIKKAFLRSDEAGCYHSNQQIIAIIDVGDRVGIKIVRYDFSEPQQGKDICDRVLCPMKAAIRRYCAEGHNILNTANMREALENRPVKGTTAAVCILNEESKDLDIHKLDHISELHNFQYEKKGLRVWKAYNIGKGDLILWKSLFFNHQGPTNLSLAEGQGFFENTERWLAAGKKADLREKEIDGEQPCMFLCPEDGCSFAFDSFSELELHIEIGEHEREFRKHRNLYDNLRLDWAAKFSSIENYDKTIPSMTTTALHPKASKHSTLKTGWALAKPRTGGIRFSDNVRNYLNAKFEIGKRTGRKADPEQVSQEMRNARNEQNERRFKREEWLTKTQITSFFSRLASKQRNQAQDVSEKDKTQPENVDDRDTEAIVQENDRCALIDSVRDAIGLKHPVMFDTYDLCDYNKKEKLGAFNIPMLKSMLHHCEVPYRSRDKKKWF